MRQLIHEFSLAFSAVFRRWRFVVVAIVAMVVAWLLITIVIQFSFWSDIWAFSEFSVPMRLHIILSSIGVWGVSFTTAMQTLTGIIIILTGINTALFVFYLQHRIQTASASSLGFWGMLVSLFGVGCASCGSAILTALIGFGAATTVVAALPLHGLEFTIVGLIAICVSIGVLTHRIARPGTCRIPSTRTMT